MRCKVYKSKIFDDDIEVIAEGSKNILTYKRRSKPVEDRNKEYFEAVELQAKDSLRGGLKKGSGYHYDRNF
jgi:hypothetical protein